MSYWVGALGALLFLCVFLVDGATRPGYSSVRHTVSALALGPRGWLQRANFVVGGASITWGGAGMLTSGDHLLLGVAVTALGLGLVASVVPMDPMRGYPPGTAEADPEEFTAAHALHDGAGALVFLALPVVSAVSAFALPGITWTVGAALMTVVLVAAMAAFERGWREDSPTTGVAQRAVLLPGLVWVATVLLALRG